MKQIRIIAALATLLAVCSCGQSNEEKAQQMAADYLKGTLYHFDSYEPLKTIVDSSFVSLTNDKEAVELTLDMLKLFQRAEEYAKKIEYAESSMETWSRSGYSSVYSEGDSTAYSEGDYRRAKEERENNQELLDKTKERIQKQFTKIKSRQSYLEAEAPQRIGDFDGWKVYHKFKSLNGAGTVDLLGEYIFFCDKDFNEKSAYSKKDYDAISKIMTAISSSDDISEMIEKVQDEIY